MDYFTAHEDELTAREDYKEGMPIWTIFRVSKEKLGRKVGWQELDKRMGAVQLPIVFDDAILGKRLLIVLQTVYFVAEDGHTKAIRIEKLLNSTPVRCFISSFAERARGGYFRHISWTVGLVPLPRSLDSVSVQSDDNELSITSAYGLTRSQTEALRNYYAFVSGPSQSLKH
jgi:hypothetical protein